MFVRGSQLKSGLIVSSYRSSVRIRAAFSAFKPTGGAWAEQIDKEKWYG